MTVSNGRCAVPATGPDAAAVYALGSNPDESARLRRPSDELHPQSAELTGRIGLRPGQRAIDVGCGPSGIPDLLAAAVSPGGRVVGLDVDPSPTVLARRHVGECGLAGVEVVTADARAHRPAVALLRPRARQDAAGDIPDPAGVVRLARPVGWVAIGELGRSDEHELAELDRAVREHLADPRTLVMPHLFVVARDRKPARNVRPPA